MTTLIVDCALMDAVLVSQSVVAITPVLIRAESERAPTAEAQLRSRK